MLLHFSVIIQPCATFLVGADMVRGEHAPPPRTAAQGIKRIQRAGRRPCVVLLRWLGSAGDLLPRWRPAACI